MADDLVLVTQASRQVFRWVTWRSSPARHLHGCCGLSLFSSGVDTDELDSNVDDWEEETIEFFVTEETIPLGSQE